jgi:peptide/nickel transport system permease protein
MTVYVLKRLGFVIFSIAIVSVLVFLSTHALPDNTAMVILGEYATPESVAALEEKLGLNRPLHVQYREWVSLLLQGDFGRSLTMERPIGPMLWPALANSAIIAAATMLILPFVAIALGVFAAVRRGRLADHIHSLFAYVGVSIPEFLWCLLLILVFASWLGWLPTSGSGTADEGLWSYAVHLVLPVAALTVTLIPHVSRMTRSSMLEALDSNYVRAARARGLPERAVIVRHALRNAMLPTITVLAHNFGFLIGGIVAIETVFAYPGLGRLLVSALERHDLPLVQAAVMVLTIIFCLENLFADLAYAYLNPRIRYGRPVD